MDNRKYRDKIGSEDNAYMFPSSVLAGKIVNQVLTGNSAGARLNEDKQWIKMRIYLTYSFFIFFLKHHRELLFKKLRGFINS